MESNLESGKGAKRRTTLIPRVKVNNIENSLNSDGLNNRRLQDNTENGKDSGLSSESSTPTGGSPPPRQQKIVSPSTLSNSIVANRGRNDTARIGSARTSRLLRSRTGSDSPRSLDSVRTRQLASPLRPVLPGNGQTLSVDSGDDGSPRLERCNYHQDIVYIKTGLLKLMRVIQESEEKNLTRAETLNPFNNSLMNGLFHNLNEEGITETGVPLTNGALNVADELTDLRRQVIFLEGQLEDKDRVIQQLQLQVLKQKELLNSVDSQSCASSLYSSNVSSMKDVSNAATQTEKIRPVSAGPALLQGFPQDSSMGPLVSWNETWNHQKLPSQQPSTLMGSNSLFNKRENKKTSEMLHPLNMKSRPEQMTNCLNGKTPDKSAIDSTTIRRIIKSREMVASRVIGPNNSPKESSSRMEIPKSCIPSLKKVTTMTYVPRTTRGDMLITGRSHNS